MATVSPIGHKVAPEQEHTHVLDQPDNFDPVRTFESRIHVPDDDDGKKSWFSFRKLWAFTGPGFLMSIAYLDPGNIESDLQSGAVAQYKLVWVLLGAHILGLTFQRMAARLSVVTGKDLAEICYLYYPKVPRVFLWVMIELLIIESDMQEVIGTAIAFYLISGKRIPLYGGVLITIADTFTFLLLDRFGVRKLETFFGLLMAVMAGSFGYEYLSNPPNQGELLKGMFFPWCSGCGRSALLQAVALFGAVISPYNLFLHSSLVKSREVDRSKKRSISEANKYFFIESTAALFCSFMINLFVLGVFGHGLYGKTNNDVRELCMSSDYEIDNFANNTEPATVDIYHAGIFLGCQYGAVAMYIWAVGLLASGQSSTMTGTYAGQFIMEGFLNLHWAKWKRVLFTRSIALIPALVVAVNLGIENFSSMNDFLNSIQALQLPFAIIPALTFASSATIMHEFKMSRAMSMILPILSFGVLSINMYSLMSYVTGKLGDLIWAYVIIAMFLFVYAIFVIYLLIYWLQSLGLLCCSNHWVIKKLFPMNPKLESILSASWKKNEEVDDHAKTGLKNFDIPRTEVARF